MTTFSTTRLLQAVPAAVFAAMSDPARLARWWGPAGFSNAFTVFEFVPGGRWVLTMIGPDGTTYPNESVFAAIETDRRLVIEHLSRPHFTLTISLHPEAGGTRVGWAQAFADDAVAAAVRALCEPANEQNLDRLSAEVCERSVNVGN